MSSNLGPAERGFQVRPGVFALQRGEEKKAKDQGFQQVSGTPPFVTLRIRLRGLTNPCSSLNPGEQDVFLVCEEQGWFPSAQPCFL